MIKVITLIVCLIIWRVEFFTRLYPFLSKISTDFSLAFNNFFDKNVKSDNESFYRALFRATFFPGLILIITILSIDVILIPFKSNFAIITKKVVLLGYFNVVSAVLIAFAAARGLGITFLLIKRIKTRAHSSFENFILEFSIVLAVTAIAYSIDYFIAFKYLDTAFKLIPQEPIHRQFLEFLYFSIVTMATVGYGDISPTCITTRALVSIEIIQAFALIIIILANYGNFLRNKTKAER